MKKTAAVILVLLLMISCFGGCAKKQKGQTEATPVPSDMAVKEEEKKEETQKASPTPSATPVPRISTAEEQKRKAAEMGFAFEAVEEKVRTKKEVNVRTACSLDSEVLKLLEAGVELTRTGYNQEWSRVIVNNGTYYMATDFLEKVEDGVITNGEGKKVALDAGSQSQANTEQEPLGPGSQTTKNKVSAGGKGVSSGAEECEINLRVTQKLKEELLSRGYEVIMIRESNDVNISNAQRAEMANQSGAEVFLRILANQAEDASINGIMTICPTEKNPYVSSLYQSSRQLSESILNHTILDTNANNRGVWETDTMSGINWSKIPVSVIEIGYISNPEEDKLLADEAYQTKLVTGIADGLDEYFQNK